MLERLFIFDRAEGRIEKPAQAGRRALSRAERARIEDDRLEDVLVNLADALAHAGEDDEVERCFRRALDAEGQDSVEWAKTLNICGGFLSHQRGQLEEGLTPRDGGA